MNAIELATAYAKLKAQFNLTTAEIAKRVGKKENSIVNTLRMLNLSDEVKKAAVEHKLPEGVLRPLVNADEKLVKKVLPKIVDEGWSARKVERYMAENKPKSSVNAVKVRQYLRDENKLSEKYGVEVRVKGRSLNFACKDEKELRALIRKFI